MKNIIPKDTRYIPFTQQNSCCVPTSISIIMYKLGIPLLPIELLGYHLGLILDKDKKSLFWSPRVGPRPKAGYGTQIYDKKYEINSVFRKLKIPIKVSSYLLSTFKDKKELILFLSKNIKDDKDIIVFLGSDVLNNTLNNNGHACVVDRIYPSKNIVRLIDPSSNQPKWREIKIEKFIQAIKKHPTGLGKFSVLEKK